MALRRLKKCVKNRVNENLKFWLVAVQVKSFIQSHIQKVICQETFEFFLKISGMILFPNTIYTTEIPKTGTKLDKHSLLCYEKSRKISGEILVSTKTLNVYQCHANRKYHSKDKYIFYVFWNDSCSNYCKPPHYSQFGMETENE